METEAQGVEMIRSPTNTFTQSTTVVENFSVSNKTSNESNGIVGSKLSMVPVTK